MTNPSDTYLCRGGLVFLGLRLLLGRFSTSASFWRFSSVPSALPHPPWHSNTPQVVHTEFFAIIPLLHAKIFNLYQKFF